MLACLDLGVRSRLLQLPNTQDRRFFFHHSGMEDIIYAAADGIGGEENDWQLACNAKEFAMGLLGQFDIVSDFLFWWSIRKDPDVDVAVRWLVFAFALAGAILELIFQFLKFDAIIHSSSFKKTEWAEEKKGPLLLVRQVAIVVLEDIPQMVLLLYIVMVEKKGGEWTDWMILSFVLGMMSMFSKLLDTLFALAVDFGTSKEEGQYPRTYPHPTGELCCFLTIHGKNWCIIVPGPSGVLFGFGILCCIWYSGCYNNAGPCP